MRNEKYLFKSGDRIFSWNPLSHCNINSKRNCECCGCAYAGGKQYGEYQCIIPWTDINGVIIEPKGLCESCNPSKDNVWFNSKLKCHGTTNKRTITEV